MKLDKIRNYLDKLKRYLESESPFYEHYKWENIQNFQSHWDLNASDLQSMYDQALSSKISGRLWGGSHNSPKAMMLEMLRVNPDFMRSAFKDLLVVDEDIMLRTNRFVYHCDQIMEEVHKSKPKLVKHYHDNFKILSVYLTFSFPMDYCIFDYKAFRQMMVKLEVTDIPQDYEVNRFFKICKNLYKIISEDKDFMELHQKQIIGEEFYQQPSLLLVHDFFWCCTRPEYGIA